MVPAAGHASRLGILPGSKELLPLGFGEDRQGRWHPKVVSHYLLDKFLKAGVRKTFMILRSGKWDIPEYYRAGAMVGMDLAYLVAKYPFGVPYTLDTAYPFIGDAVIVTGFPDILFQPEDAFAQAGETFVNSRADIVLGLFTTRDGNQRKKCDLVRWDSRGRIQEIVIKPQQTNLRLSWILAVWGPAFSEFMHAFLADERANRQGEAADGEIHLGHVIQKALQQGLKVHGHLFPGQGFIDVGTPDSLARAMAERLPR